MGVRGGEGAVGGCCGLRKGSNDDGGGELSLAAREGLKLGESGKLSGALASCQRVVEAGEGKWLSRSLEGCHKVPWMGGMGVADAGYCRELPEDGGNRVDGGRGSVRFSYT